MLLNIGLTPVEIKEAVYQCTPNLGFPKTLNAVAEVNEAFNARKITLPIESQKQEEAPANQKHLQEYLSSFCFGDFHTRGGYDLKAHVLGNHKMGTDKISMITAITHCLL